MRDVDRFAHTAFGVSSEHWELLEAHLAAVSQVASNFVCDLRLHQGDATGWGILAGRWHDLGKFSDDFQAMLRATSSANEAHLEDKPGRVDHSTAGAQHACSCVAGFGRLLAYTLAGHHSGLADARELDERLAKPVAGWAEHAPSRSTAGLPLGPPPLSFEHKDARRSAFQCSLFTRMLFSCLIDADRLETEAFCNPEQAAERIPAPSIHQLSATLDAELTRLAAHAEPTPVNQHRRDILAACRSAAAQSPGFFSLTVPTGGGKTLASLAFALDHAKQHGHRRVVMAIPYTSIVEQTADVYRRVFQTLGDGALVEHHSGLDPDKETRLNRLAAENWDAPLVVTTNVQLFESLFASRTTPCRKLHRVAGSVIILDEAQTLPVDLLKPCLWALRELVTDYGCSIVLCTATQPALERRRDFKIGIEGVREIIPEPTALYAQMRRARVKSLGVVGNDDLIEKLHQHGSWLTIVNTKAHAAELYRRLAGDSDSPADLFHLSTRMCGQHRSDQLAAIRERLKNREPCRVVSTQLIEAGVDVDFPVVLRAMAGVDSIAQAAGRCNREGKLPGLGTLWLFDPAEVQPKGELGATAAKTRELLPDYPGGDAAADLLDPAAVRRYFELWYWSREGDNAWDAEDVLGCFPEEHGKFAYDFRTASERFRIIKDETQTVFVPYGDGERLIDGLRREGPSRWLLRKLQRYAVGLRDWECQALVTSRDVEFIEEGFGVLANPDLYCQHLGLTLDRPGFRKPESMVL
ncbi:MAG: CRISPR-associated helicase Cas3' [Planctomycetota bacterium]